MFKLMGKYNTATVMLPDASMLDQATKQQITTFLGHPAFAEGQIVIMPDVHAGKGAVIGFTMPLGRYVIPNVVGVDIGCGVLTHKLGNIKVPFQKLDDFIRKHIPSGFQHHKSNPLEIDTVSQYINSSEEELVYQRVKKLCEKMDLNYDMVLHSLGSLGGGNHFIEVGQDKSKNKWLTIHSGSRNFGLQVCNFHQRRARQLSEAQDHSDNIRHLEYLPLDNGGEEYLEDMRTAQEYAMLNRKIMAILIIEGFFGIRYPTVETILSVHNFIDFEDRIIRKGAIRAYQGEKLVIPFNMEDGLIIAEGLSNPDWNYSAPHGAGRVLSRKQAKKTLDLKYARESMQKKGIWTSSLSNATLDEAKDAYKPKNMIIDAMKPTVKVLFFVQPIYNFKAVD